MRGGFDRQRPRGRGPTRRPGPLAVGLLGACLCWPRPLASAGEPHGDAPAPRLADRPRPPGSSPEVEGLLRRLGERLVSRARLHTYGARVTVSPLIAEAALSLLDALAPYAREVWVTSVARAPHDQRRLLRAAATRDQAIARSKHLLGGLAVDLGFVGRKTSLARLGEIAAEALQTKLGPDRAHLLRVVVEPRCLHVEIATDTGRALIDARVRHLWRQGVLRRLPEGHPVPEVRDYIPEHRFVPRPWGRLSPQAF